MELDIKWISVHDLCWHRLWILLDLALKD